MLVDSIIIGRLLGVDSMSAYGLALPLLTLLIALGTMICCGIQIVCAKALGFGNLDDAGACYSTSIVISLTMAVVGTLLIFIACDPICMLLGAGKADHIVFIQTGEFLKGYFLGAPFGLPGFWIGAICGQAATFAVISLLVWKKSGRISFSADAYCYLEPEFGVDSSDCMTFSITGQKKQSPENNVHLAGRVVEISENVVNFCRQKGLDRKLCMMIGLCIEEMGMNIIRYGFSEDDRTHFLDIRAIVREEQCIIHFRGSCS